MPQKDDLHIYTKLANKYNIPKSTVKVICHYPFKFARERMADDDDTKSIMFAHLFKFIMKPKFKQKYEQSNGQESGEPGQHS